MTDTKHTSITSLIEQRIRRELQDEARKTVNAFEARLEADIEGLGVSALWTGMSKLVEEVRAKHIDNLVTHRIDALVDQLVDQLVPEHINIAMPTQLHPAGETVSGSGVDALNEHTEKQIITSVSIDSANMELIVAKILTQMEIQTAIMADNAKKAERDSKLYQDTLSAHMRDKKVAAQAEPATVTATAFQLGDKVMLKSGGPVMTVVVAMENGSLMCGWMNGDGVSRAPFLPVCLSRAPDRTSHGSIRV